MKEILLELVWWTWCLPQTLLGYILKLIFKGEEKTIMYRMKAYTYYNTTLTPGSVSLGKYVLLCKDHHDDIDTIKHEHGHQIQSLILGPLYLLVVSLPSLIWAGCFEIYRAKHEISYYQFYTEKWAEELSLVKPLSVIEAIILNVEDPWFYYYELRDEEDNTVVGGDLHTILDSRFRVNTVVYMFEDRTDRDVYVLYIEVDPE
jgi:hypothetical protein